MDRCPSDGPPTDPAVTGALERHAGADGGGDLLRDPGHMDSLERQDQEHEEHGSEDHKEEEDKETSTPLVTAESHRTENHQNEATPNHHQAQ
jgi:hypothetical protein